MKKPEILAPAGNMEALRAAIANGADAIYLGGKKFGARASSANFSDEEIIEAINLAHIHKIKIYVTMNTLIFDNEVEEFIQYANFLYINQVDSIIVQDIGMFYLLRKNFPDLHLHCSTQMNAVNNLDVDYWTSKGATRVVLARENTSMDIKSIKEKTGAELEVFVHGALCMSYSGKCLFSALEGGRSGNRGECSQPCRMKYSLDTGNEISKDSYLLSTKDLSTITAIDELVELPIDSFKLEGRMKRGEYVAKVTSTYKQGIQEGTTQEQLNNLENEIEHIFNRNYTKGYVLGEKGSSIANRKSPKNMGVIAATVLSNNKEKKRLKLQLTDDVQVGDGLSTGELIGRIILNGKLVDSAQKGETIELDYIGTLQEGDTVYKTYAKKIMVEAKNSYENYKANYPLDMKLELKIGKTPKLTVTDENRQLTVEEEILVEVARSQPLSVDRIKQQLSKLGDSIYSLRELEVEKDEEGTIPVSVINKLRRDAVIKITEERTKVYNRQNLETVDYTIEPNEDVDYPVTIGVFCNTKEQLRAAKDEKIARVCVKTKELYIMAKEMFEATAIYFQLPLVIREHELNSTIEDIKELGNNFVVSSLGMVKYLENKTTVAHYLLNLANEYSLGTIETNFVMPSLEMLYDNPADNIKHTQWYDKMEIPVYQRPILMISEYCPYKLKSGHCESKDCKLSISTLKNQQGHEFPLEKEGNCKMIVLGKKVTRLDKYIPEFLRAGINRYNINLQNGILAESYTDSRNIIKEYKKLLF